MNDKRSVNRELSTTRLAKELNISLPYMFQMLVDMNMIVRNGNSWDLTSTGKSNGGLYKNHDKIGRYIVWPESISAELDEINEDTGQLLTATSIGKNFQIPAERINYILSEFGWIKKDPVQGWHITELGKRFGGIQSKYKTTGKLYVRWPQSILENKILITSVLEAKGNMSAPNQDQPQNAVTDTVDFRDKFPPAYRAKDGHKVRSKSEVLIDNYLYESNIVHAYERKVPIDEDLLSDFYIPKGNVYIEHWGLDDPKYLARKKRKLEIYNKYGLNLIEFVEKDVSKIDDTLPATLRDFGVAVE
jgi:hypothetical protein